METVWTCPHCNKAFAKANQSHICSRVPVEELFVGKEQFLPVYLRLLEQFPSDWKYSVTTSHKAITLYAANARAFLVISPKKKFLDIWFSLDRKIEEFPVFRVQQASKSRFAHFLRVYDASDIDRLFMGLIAKGHAFISEK